ncbi:MAG: metallopeptidase TldD-related protein [Acidimicrobiales bacterium]
MNGRGGALIPAHQVVERGIAASSGDGCAVIVHDGSETDLRFAVNTVTTNGIRRYRSVTVISFLNKGEGTAVGIASASGSVDVEDLLRAAESDASRADPADDASPLIVGAAAFDFEDAPVLTEPEVLHPVLSKLGGAFDRARSSDRVLAGFAEHAITTTYLGTSTGTRLRHVQPTGKIEFVARDSAGQRSAWTGLGTKDFSDVDLDVAEARLVQRLGWAAKQIEMPAGRYEVVLPPDAVADLVLMLGEATSGKEAEEGRSVFSAPGGGTKVGESLSGTPFDLRSDPAEAGIECLPFVSSVVSTEDRSVFDNGLRIEPTFWLKEGRLDRLRYHRAGAAKSKQPVTPPIDNLVLEVPGADGSLDSMIGSSDRALLLTCLWYIREVDPSTLLLTGLTRDGVYLVEKGEIVGAVNNFRFNESPIDLLRKTTEVGRAQRCISREWNEYFNRTKMPPLRVEGFNMSSVSPAT